MLSRAKRTAAAAQQAQKAATGVKGLGAAMQNNAFAQKAAPKSAQAATGVAKRLGMKDGGGVKKMAKGGGCEVKGKTKGTMVKMAKGGKSC
jgi:hypothetical protein